MRRTTLALAALAATLAAGAASAQTIRSVYTNLDERSCRTVESNPDEGGWVVQRCPGAFGWRVMASEGDLRSDITLADPRGREHPLRFGEAVTSAFSSLGPRMEWRARGGRPHAVIVRVNASEDQANPARATSYLVVARIAPGQVCVTDRVAPGPRQNAIARQYADARGRPCRASASAG